jgi:hypothetical protein
MENKNSNKIIRLEEIVKHLATKEDMSKSHEEIRDQIQSLQYSIDGLLKELKDIIHKNGETHKLAKEANDRSKIAYTQTIALNDQIKLQNNRIEEAVKRMDYHIEGHKMRVLEDIELSIFKSSRIRKVLILSLIIFAYLLTFGEVRNLVSNIPSFIFGLF